MADNKCPISTGILFYEFCLLNICHYQVKDRKILLYRISYLKRELTILHLLPLLGQRNHKEL